MYVILQMAGTVLLSLIGSTMLKLSDGFSNLPPTVLFLITYCLAFYLFSLALRTLPLSVGYAVWSGCSTAGNALVGHICFQEPLGYPHIFVLLIIILGIILINNARITAES